MATPQVLAENDGHSPWAFEDPEFEVQLTNALEATDAPATAAEAIAPLAAIGVDTTAATAALEAQRLKWQHSKHFENLSSTYQCDLGTWFMEYALVIFAYTLAAPSVFRPVNMAINEEGRMVLGGLSDKIKASLKFVKMLDAALSLLPESFTYAGELWRGFKWVYPSPSNHDPAAHFQRADGVYRVWTMFSFKSFTCNKNLMRNDEFCGLQGPRTVLHVRGFTGKSIREFSDFPTEDEIVARPLERLRVVSVSKQCDPQSPDLTDPFTHADSIEAQAIHATVPRTTEPLAVAAAAYRILDGSHLPAALETAKLLTNAGSHVRTPKITFVGPNNSGKSTLVNGYLGTMVAPMAPIPETILPVVFERGNPGDEFDISVNGVGLMEMLKEAAAKQGKGPIEEGSLTSLNRATFHGMLCELNRIIRKHVEDLETLPGPDIFREWHLGARVPGGPCPFMVCDLPGTTEGGRAGTIARETVRKHTEESCASVLVCSLENSQMLQEVDRVAGFFGGAVPPQSSVIVAINKIAGRDARAKCSEMLEKPDTKKAFVELGSKLGAAPQPLMVDAISIFAKRALPKNLPATDDPQFADVEPTLREVFSAAYPFEDFKEDYDERRMERTLSKRFDDFHNATFLDALDHARSWWPTYVALSFVTRIRATAEKEIADLERQAKAYDLTVEAAKQKFDKLTGLLDPDGFEKLAATVHAAIQEASSEAYAAMGPGIDLFGTTECGALDRKKVRTVLGEEVAEEWAANAWNRIGGIISDELGGSPYDGRVLSSAGADAVVQAFTVSAAKCAQGLHAAAAATAVCQAAGLEVLMATASPSPQPLPRSLPSHDGDPSNRVGAALATVLFPLSLPLAGAHHFCHAARVAFAAEFMYGLGWCGQLGDFVGPGELGKEFFSAAARDAIDAARESFAGHFMEVARGALEREARATKERIKASKEEGLGVKERFLRARQALLRVKGLVPRPAE